MADGAQVRPNILFIIADDHASKAISCYGPGINNTPNLDRVAKEGMIFHHCYVTNSICTPSRATVLTGMHNHVNEVLTLDSKTNNRLPNVAKALRVGGYQYDYKHRARAAKVARIRVAEDVTYFDLGLAQPDGGSRVGNMMDKPSVQDRKIPTIHDGEPLKRIYKEHNTAFTFSDNGELAEFKFQRYMQRYLRTAQSI
ncbi:mucin-desulfating sulfatase (n-acetylglucosamine-6-sulfatase) [Seiridium cupressi]